MNQNYVIPSPLSPLSPSSTSTVDGMQQPCNDNPVQHTYSHNKPTTSVFQCMLRGYEHCVPVYDDGQVAAVVDKDAIAPVHIIVFTKAPLGPSLTALDASHADIVGHLVLSAVEVMR
jgi:hypothetical protein